MTNIRNFILVVPVLLKEINHIFLQTSFVFNMKVKGNMPISRQRN